MTTEQKRAAEQAARQRIDADFTRIFDSLTDSFEQQRREDDYERRRETDESMYGVASLFRGR